MSDRPKDDQPVPGETNKPVPKQPEGQPPHPENADDREGQTREPGYDEA